MKDITQWLILGYSMATFCIGLLHVVVNEAYKIGWISIGIGFILQAYWVYYLRVEMEDER